MLRTIFCFEQLRPYGGVGCRLVFKDCPIFLCTFHVTKAWLEQIRQKLFDKEQMKPVYKGLRKILYMKPPGDDLHKHVAVEAAVEEFRKRFKEEEAMLKWFDRMWLPDIRMSLFPCRFSTVHNNFGEWSLICRHVGALLPWECESQG